MSNRLLSFLVLLMLPYVMAAQNTEIIGYCSDDLEGADVIGVEGEARLSAAIRLPKSVMQRYKDGKIVRIKMAVREGVEKTSVWIRKTLNASSDMVQSAGTLQYGWNEVVLNEPYLVDGEEIYIGYTFTQPDDKRVIMAKGAGNENTSLLAIENEWDDYHNQGVGILFIQAVVEGDFPACDLAVIDGSTDSLHYCADGEMKAVATIENVGAENIQSFHVTWSIDGVEPLPDDTAYGPLAPSDTLTLSRQFSLDGFEEGQHFLDVTVGTSAGDERDSNNTYSIPFFVYSSTYPRTLLLEHFTSLPCVNCPPVDKLLEDVVATRDDVAWVAHHVGYRNDEFTIEASEPFLSFGVYGNPFIMIDREKIVGETPAFVISGFSADDMQLVFDMAAEHQAFVSITPSLAIDDGLLKVEVAGEAKAFFQSLFPRATVNVFIVEDSVLAVGTQAGDSKKRYHDNILRAVLTRKSGDRIQWVDDTHFSMMFSTDVDDSWQLDKLRAVTFITAAADRGSGYPTGEVLNAAQVGVSDTNSIRLATASHSPEQFYTINGVPVNSRNLKHGLYIMVDGNGARKAFIK